MAPILALYEQKIGQKVQSTGIPGIPQRDVYFLGVEGVQSIPLSDLYTGNKGE
jgi:hypothetical protein